MDAAWIGASGVLVGGVVTSLLSMSAESARSKRQAVENERQRAHELGVRELELREEHRGRLHAERRAAYAEFSRTYHRYELAGMRLVKAMTDHQQEPENAAYDVAYAEAFDQFVLTSEALSESLIAVEVVASSQVEEAARELRLHSKHLGVVVDDSISDEVWAMESARLQKTEHLQMALRLAIRSELQLDR